MQYILGIDGGGSKTIAILADCTGKVVGSAQAGASNYQTIGLESACNSLITVIMEALDGAKATLGTGLVDLERIVIVVGLAGADRPWDKASLSSMLTGKLPRKPGRFLMENDARIALAGATGIKPGIILIAGTGSIALGIDDAGSQVRVGGWGPLLGDEGSGYSIGKAALTAILREHDGRGKPTSLTGKVLSHLSLTSPEEIIPLVYQGPLERPDIARLAELVLEEASQGDPVSQHVVIRAAKQLVEMIGTVLSRLGLTNRPTTIAATGGLLRPGNPLWEAIDQQLNEYYPLSNLAPPLLSPVLGAVLLGRDLIDATSPYDEFMDNLTLYHRVSNTTVHRRQPPGEDPPHSV
jgi:N-acetylglucosamine kinase-like BadF-type ATPase